MAKSTGLLLDQRSVLFELLIGAFIGEGVWVLVAELFVRVALAVERVRRSTKVSFLPKSFGTDGGVL
jgi:hypothetical protein